jgi:hypothetical protein
MSMSDDEDEFAVTHGVFSQLVPVRAPDPAKHVVFKFAL